MGKVTVPPDSSNTRVRKADRGLAYTGADKNDTDWLDEPGNENGKQ
jgi:hypothetical protein